MEITTLSFANIHEHGVLFANLFRERHSTFIGRNGWELPECDGMEYDQYDTPASRWVAIHEDGEVRAGVRLTPTTARCGIYTYMIRDAQVGVLENMPRDLLFEEAPVAPHVWEASRIFVASSVPAAERFRVHCALNVGMISAARGLGAARLLSIIPENLPRLVRRNGIACRAAGPVLAFGGEPCLCVETDVAAAGDRAA